MALIKYLQDNVLGIPTPEKQQVPEAFVIHVYFGCQTKPDTEPDNIDRVAVAPETKQTGGKHKVFHTVTQISPLHDAADVQQAHPGLNRHELPPVPVEVPTVSFVTYTFVREAAGVASAAEIIG